MKNLWLLCLILLVCDQGHLVLAQDDATPTEIFLDAVESGETSQVLDLMHPKLAERIDAPILEAWLQAVAFRLGPVKDVLPTTTVESEEKTELTSNVIFTKGTAKVTLTVYDDTIVFFEVQSDALSNWFQRPTSLDLYRSRVEDFLTALTDEDYDSALQLVHQESGDPMDREELRQYREQLRESLGTVEQTRFQYAKLTVLEDERLEQVDLYYKISGSHGRMTGEFTFRFQGMQGELIGFRFR